MSYEFDRKFKQWPQWLAIFAWIFSAVFVVALVYGTWYFVTFYGPSLMQAIANVLPF